jgi:hypothetical protein
MDKFNQDRDASLVPQILECARTYPEGFTLDLRTRRHHCMDRGYVVAVENPDTDNIPATLALARKHNLHLLGGWWDGKEERYEFDACAWFEDCSEAVAFAKANSQKAIYDCGEKVVIDLRVEV